MKTVKKHEWVNGYRHFMFLDNETKVCIHCKTEKVYENKKRFGILGKRGKAVKRLPTCITRTINAPQREADR